jgi:hypothetical protein
MDRKQKTLKNPQYLEDWHIKTFFQIKEELGKAEVFNIITGLNQRKKSTIKQYNKIYNVVRLEEQKNS